MPDIWMDVDVALAEVPVNLMPLIDDTDFKTIEDAVAYNASGMALRWHFVTTGGAYTVTSVTPTSGGDYDWTDHGDSGIYTIEIPASGGASINNNTEGFGWFTGKATGIYPWRGPVIGFRAAGLNNLLIDDAFSSTRGLAGTALPDAAAEAAGGLYTRGSGSGQIGQDANGRANVNVKAINDDANAALRAALFWGKVRQVTVDNSTFSPTTTAFETDQTTDDAARYSEQVLFGLDGNNTAYTVRITGYAFTNSKVKLTVDALPAAPSNGHRFLLMGRIEQ